MSYDRIDIGFRSETDRLWPGEAFAIVRPVYVERPFIANSGAGHTVWINRYSSQYPGELMVLEPPFATEYKRWSF
jgi:hypothetical protein